MTNRNHDHFRDLTKMVEYISRSDAIEAIKNDALEMVYYGKEAAIECLGAVPAADVRPVVYGEWIPPNYPVCCAIRCSVCGETEYLDEPEQYKDWDFCPHCGADMRGEKERNNG